MAAEALLALGPRAEKARSALETALLADRSAHVRKSASLALGELGRCPLMKCAAHTEDVLLFVAQHDEDDYVRQRARCALALLGIECQGSVAPEDECVILPNSGKDMHGGLQLKASRPHRPFCTWTMQEEDASTAEPSRESSFDHDDPDVSSDSFDIKVADSHPNKQSHGATSKSSDPLECETYSGSQLSPCPSNEVDQANQAEQAEQTPKVFKLSKHAQAALDRHNASCFPVESWFSSWKLVNHDTGREL
jgi:hypothetical protein